MSLPALRFKDEAGQDFPEWGGVALGKVITIMSGISPSNYSLTASGAYPFLKVEDLNNCSKYQIESREYSKSTKNLVPKESIIFPKRGAAILNNKVRTTISPVLMDSNLMAITPIGNELNFEFLYYKILNDKLYKIADTSTIPQINNKHILPYIVSLPKIAEQTKIANFLTAVDEKITQLTQKNDLLTQYKKGVMQQIFSQELRFKDEDGQDFPEWEDTTLGELCSITTGKLDANAMIENGEYRFYTCAKEFYRIDDYAFDTDALLVSGNGANVGYIHHYKGKFNAYQRTYVLDRFEENIIFIKYFLDAFLHVRIFKEAKEGNTPYIVMGTLTEMSVRLPKLAEQTKIANFLTAIDDKISSTKTQLQAVKQYKQGLLQQMFV